MACDMVYIEISTEQSTKDSNGNRKGNSILKFCGTSPGKFKPR